MCITGKGTGAGQKALTARCSMTTESLPPENSRAGFSIVAATSRMMCTASDSSLSRWLISYATVIAPLLDGALSATGPPADQGTAGAEHSDGRTGTRRYRDTVRGA